MTAPPAGPRGRLAQWAAVLLPVVFGLRALLLVFQLSGEHHSRKPVVLAWPPAPGERLPFEGGNAGIRAWAAQAEHPAIPAMLIDKNGERMPAGTGYMLNPEAMAGLVGGRLTLQSQDADGYWTARWSWAVTMPTWPSPTLAGAAPRRSARCRRRCWTPPIAACWRTYS